jgi:uncharacterized cupredoxin-like copper-binding protein
MKNLLTLILLTLTYTSALAGGTHDHGHGKAEFAVGEPTEDKPDRVFDVSMRDTMRFVFSPEFEDLHDGEVIRFNVRNDGKILHEFSIGNAAEQMEHAKMMRDMPNMKHEDPNTVSLEPGASATITWRFKGQDTVVFSCNIPGHFEAGMHHDLAIIGSHSS